MKQAVAGLAQEGKVVCVRLALFAEMMKGKPWTPATLKEVGGTEGVGVTFLEETFCFCNGHPEAPPSSEGGQGGPQSPACPNPAPTSRATCGRMPNCWKRRAMPTARKDFDDLIRILDSEIRLITPTDPEGKEEADGSAPAVKAGEKYYQLTHDYLVPSLREWLTRKQRETRKGRAELRLAERSALWNAKPENQHLPSLWEFLNIRLLTDRKNWTEPQRKMMGQAGRVHAIRSGIVAAVLVVASLAGMSVRNAVVEKQNVTRAEGLVDALVNADITQVPSIVISLAEYRTWADPLLKTKFEQAKEGSSQQLNTALALLPVDESKVNYLRDQLIVVTPQQFPIVRDALLTLSKPGGPDRTSLGRGARLEAGNAAHGSKRPVPWRRIPPTMNAGIKIGSLVAGHLVSLQASDFLAWRKALEPAKGRTDRAVDLDLRGQGSTRTKPHLRHRGPGGLCRRPARRPVQSARHRRAISISRDVRQADRPPRKGGCFGSGRTGEIASRRKPAKTRKKPWPNDRPMPPWPFETGSSRKGLARLRSIPSSPIHGSAATSFIGSARWGAIRRRSSSDWKKNPT